MCKGYKLEKFLELVFTPHFDGKFKKVLKKSHQELFKQFDNR